MTVNYKFKNTELETLWVQHQESLLQASFQYCELNFEDLKQLLKAYKAEYKSLVIGNKESINESELLKTFSKNVLNHLMQVKDSLAELHSERALSVYDQKLSEILKSQPLVIRRQEVFTSYKLYTKTSLPLFYKKLYANVNLGIKTRYRKANNFFRKALGKAPYDVQSYRIRKIAFKNMLSYFLGIEFEKKHLKLLHDLFVFKGAFAQKIWKFDELFLDRLQEYLDQKSPGALSDVLQYESFLLLEKEWLFTLSKTKEEMKIQNEKDLLDVFIQLDEKMLIADTPDLPSKMFKTSLIKQHKNQTLYTYENTMSKWANTQHAFLDDWAMDVDVMYLYLSVWDEFSILKNKISDYLTENLSLNLENLHQYINSSEEKIAQASKLVDLRKTVNDERIKNSEVFVDKMLTKTINKLSGKITQHLDMFRQNVMHLVDQVSDKRAFVKGRNYTKEIKVSEISWLSPKELIGFEALPHFLDAINKVDDFVSSHLEKARVKLIALGTVSDFSLESAQLLMTEKNGTLKQTQQTISEGYKRALLQLDEAENLLNKLKAEPIESLQIAINAFNYNIQKLKNADNVIDLQVKIVKIRAVEKVKN